MCAYVCVVYTYACVSLVEMRSFVHVCFCVCMCMCVHVHVCARVCMYAPPMCVHMCVRVYVYVCVCMCVYVREHAPPHVCISPHRLGKLCVCEYVCV